MWIYSQRLITLMPFATKKAAGVKYYSVNDRQPYLSTHYIEIQ